MKKKAVVIGGGSGAATTILALKQYTGELDISAVISVCDNGRSTGELRREFNTIPPSDIMRATLALTKYDYQTLKQIFHKTRFEGTGKLDNHYLGNLFLAFAKQHNGNFIDGLHALHQAVGAVGNAYPASLELADLCAELENGEIIVGEDEIDRPKKRKHRILRAWQQPTPMIYEPAKKAIEEADYIFIGPGSLFTSIVATLTVEGMKKGALRNSNAKVIYIAGNAYETTGEAGPSKLSDFIKELEQYLAKPLDAIVYNNHKLSAEEQTAYKEKGWGLIVFDEENLGAYTVHVGDYEKTGNSQKESGSGLSPEKLGKLLYSLMK